MVPLVAIVFFLVSFNAAVLLTPTAGSCDVLLLVYLDLVSGVLLFAIVGLYRVNFDWTSGPRSPGLAVIVAGLGLLAIYYSWQTISTGQYYVKPFRGRFDARLVNCLGDLGGPWLPSLVTALLGAGLLWLGVAMARSGISRRETERKQSDRRVRWRDRRRPAPNLAPRATTYDVALLGDATRIDLLRALAATHQSTSRSSGNRLEVAIRDGGSLFRLLATADDGVAAQAGLAWEADLVLLAIDATFGPLPVHREHLLVATHMDVPSVGIGFTNTGLANDGESLDLAEAAAREWLSPYGLPDDAPCVFDHPDAATKRGRTAAKGPTQIVKALGEFVRKRGPLERVRERRRVRARVYSLAVEEVAAPDVAGSVTNGPITVVVAGEAFRGEISGTHDIAPGATGEIDVAFAGPVRMGEGQRFLLLRGERVVATGTMLET